jgi:predicted amidophosphoribosyltransferase
VPRQRLPSRARAPLRYEGVGKEFVRTLKYGGYLRVVEKIMAPLLAGVLGASRFEVVAGAAAPRGLGRGGFNPIELMSRGKAGRIEAPFLDKLKVVSRTRNRVELSTVKRWAPTRHEGLWRENSPRRRRFHQRRHRERVFWGLRKAGAVEVYPLACVGRFRLVGWPVSDTSRRWIATWFT